MSIRHRRRAFATFCAAVAHLFGCEETDTKGWLVDRTRVLGARVEAKADASRAAIAPGESMRVTWLVGAPNGTGRLNWAYAACAPPDGNFPEPKCTRPLFASGSGASDGELVTMDLDAPAAVGDMQELQLLGAFCDGGEVSFDPTRFEATCAGGAPALLAATSVRLAAAGANRNPEIAADAILFDGAPMTPLDQRPAGPCDLASNAPVVNAGSKHTVVLRFRGDERETTSSGELERILATHVVTAGELDRQYSMLAPSDPAPKDVSVEWTAPNGGPAASTKLTEFYVVVRDGRGGTAFTRRTVCVRL